MSYLLEFYEHYVYKVFIDAWIPYHFPIPRCVVCNKYPEKQKHRQ